MYCLKCGALNHDKASKCVSCGEPLRNVKWDFPRQPYVPNYLAPAILVTLFCCFPFGIVAIVYAANAGGRLAAGDYAGALRMSKTAQRWCWVSFFFSLAVVITLLLLAFYFWGDYDSVIQTVLTTLRIEK